MNIHKLARLTPAGRGSAVRRMEAGEPLESIAAGVGTSIRTLYKWRKRWREEGEAGMLDRSSRPRHCPARTPRQRERNVVRLRRCKLTNFAIAQRLNLPLSTVSAISRRHGLGRLSALEPARPVVRYEWAAPGDMVHLDTKKLARIERVGHRIHGNRGRSVEGAGWEYLHVCIDDASRVAYSECLPDEKGVTCAAFLDRAAAWFGARGIRFHRVMTDNGCGYLSKAFRRALEDLQARHIRTRPYTPRTNGKAERFIQTCKREWAYARAYAHSDARRAALLDFMRSYNCHRPHWGLGRKTPQLRLTELMNNLSSSNS
jgi:transposase InsO family protein